MTIPMFDLMRPTASDGTQYVRCCLCFDAFTLDQLTPLPPPAEGLADVCMECTHEEALWFDREGHP